MGQSVWYKEDVAQIGRTLIACAPTWDFAAGVAALCNAIGAPVELPELTQVEVLPSSTEQRRIGGPR